MIGLLDARIVKKKCPLEVSIAIGIRGVKKNSVNKGMIIK